jgi:hypothetical protein
MTANGNSLLTKTAAVRSCANIRAHAPRRGQRMKELWAERQGLQAFAPRAEKVFVDELLDAPEKEYTRRGGRALRQFKTHLSRSERLSATSGLST